MKGDGNNGNISSEYMYKKVTLVESHLILLTEVIWKIRNEEVKVYTKGTKSLQNQKCRSKPEL